MNIQLSDKETQIATAAIEHLRQTKTALKGQQLNQYDLLDYGHTQAICVSLLSKLTGRPIGDFVK